ncbi:ligase-associated DNA damage response endonuclease PdeM [Xanthobacter sp. TB0136]|uniref:ligase-associated DNA damage response endonuclease PdeM n=1 Tax=Xanthobacter sp. TB0136 TaxID=3459177 RepID=UPI00403A12D0
MRALAESPPALTSLALAGTSVLLDPSGALFWADERVLVVADMHLEKGSAFARRGQMLPPYDSLDTLARLGALIRTHAPRLVITLGDSLHDRWAHERLSAPALDMLATLQRACTFIWIAGNHDPVPHDLGGEGVEMFQLGPFTFRHEPSPEAVSGEICGHLHPAARVSIRGRSMRRRCFITDGQRMVMPAFGAFTGGLDVQHPAIAGLFPGEHDVHLLGEGRTYRLPRRALR